MTRLGFAFLLCVALCGAGQLSPRREEWASTWTGWDASLQLNASGVCLRPWQTQTDGGPLLEERFWPPELALAGVAAHSPGSWRLLLDKLNAGLPLTLLAFGSSIVEGHAGCWADSAETLEQAGVASVPPGMNRSLAESGRCVRYGWASELMAAINASWPHPQHLLVNAGRSAANLNSFANYICIDGWVPHEGIDMLLLETHDGRSGLDEKADNATARDIERLYFLTLEKQPPRVAPLPVLLFNMWPLLPSSSPDTPGASCVRLMGANCSACGGGSQFGERLRAATVVGGNGTAEDAVHRLARHHGWTSLSMRDALAFGLSSGEPARLGWSECEWLVGWMKDWTHPGPQGKRLVADMLVGLLAETQALVENSTFASALQPEAVAPLTPGLEAPSLRKCAEGTQLAVRRADGWHYVQMEVVKGAPVYKPGWLANVSGAVLEFEVNTRMYALAKEARVQLSLQHLSSFERMGMAQVSCVGKCVCAPAQLDGHSTDPEHVSIEKELVLSVTQTRHCLVRLEVLAETRSGEHKVKLLGYTVIG